MEKQHSERRITKSSTAAEATTTSFILVISVVFTLALISPVHAANFTIVDGVTVTAPQTLNDNETGTIEAGGQLNTAGIAITASGINNTVENSGSISTLGDNSDGIDSDGADAIISNSSSIFTSGDNSDGIDSDGADAIIGNSASISTLGDNSDGVDTDGANAIINNSGSISTLGKDADGVNSDGANAIINTSGSISTLGESSSGISLSDNGVIINNSGSISTLKKNSDGINSDGTNAVISNSGSISTRGEKSDGISSSKVDVIINNSGSISTQGDNSDGIDSDGANAIISNSGSIHVTGASASGIFMDDDNVLNNSGLISSTQAEAILGNSGDQTVNLLPGSQIIGAIDLKNDGGDNDTVNIYSRDRGVSTSLTLTNVENINLFGSGVVAGDTVATVDPTGESSRSVTLSTITTSIHGVVSQRMTHTAPLKPIQVAALELSPGMLFQERKPVAWAQVFGGTYDRDAESSAMAYDANHLGFTLGYEWDVDNLRVGLMGGVVNSETETQTTSFQTEADSYYVGAYGHFNFGGVTLTTSLLGGYSDHDNTRLVIDNINGYEVAKSDFDSTFISPSVTLSSAFVLADRLEFRPSASVNYSVSWLDNYLETGTTNANLNVDDRTIKVLTAKLQLAVAYQLDSNSEFEFRVGISSRNSDDDDTDASIGGSAFSYANAGDENVSGSYAGVNLRIAAQDNLSLVADMEFGGDSDEDYVNAQMSLEYIF